MYLGIPREIKDHENRVALLPDAVAKLARSYSVLVEAGAGAASGFTDADYRRAGAKIVSRAAELWRRSALVVKVKEPQPSEFRYFRAGLKLFAFLHVAANPPLRRALRQSGVRAFAFETLQTGQGFPLLKPMSQIAGRLSVLLGSHFLRSDQGGLGILLSPTDYSPPGRVVIVGAGNVGRAAAESALGLGAQVQIFDQNLDSARSWAQHWAQSERLSLLAMSAPRLTRALQAADLAIGAIYLPGAKTPQVIRREMVQGMPRGSVLVDVAVDQGGASETTRPTSISHPIYLRYGVIHCAIPNLPSLACRSASQALSGLLLPYVRRLMNLNDERDLAPDDPLAKSWVREKPSGL